MIRVLVLIAVAGFLAGVVALAGAAALGGPELAARNWRWLILDHDGPWEHDRRWNRQASVRVGGRSDLGEQASRELAWDGSSRAVFELPAVIDYVQGPDAKLVIKGPREMVDRVALAGGKLSLDGPILGGARLRITMTAPNVTAFEVGGDSRLDIRSFRQDRLDLEASGSSEVTVEGQVRNLELELSGSSEADLLRLAVENADVDLSGAAEASIAPTEAANLEVSGSASVRLATRPKRLETDVGGAGSVTFEDGGKTSGAAAPASSRAPAPHEA